MEGDTIKVTKLRIQGVDEQARLKYVEILNALLTVGALSGVKNGSAIVHFDEHGTFRGIELHYWPWRKR